MDRTLYISGQLGLNHLAELVPGGVEHETEKVTPFLNLREEATDGFNRSPSGRGKEGASIGWGGACILA